MANLLRYFSESNLFIDRSIIPLCNTIRWLNKIYHLLLYLYWHGDGGSNIGRFCKQLNPLNGGLASPEPHTHHRPQLFMLEVGFV